MLMRPTSAKISADAEVRTIDNEDIIRVNRGGYDFYLYQRSLNESNINFFVVYMGAALAAVVLSELFHGKSTAGPGENAQERRRRIEKATSIIGSRAIGRTG